MKRRHAQRQEVVSGADKMGRHEERCVYSASLLQLLRGAGYDGPYAVEVEFDGTWPPLAEVTAAMRASREALAELGLS